MTEEFNFDVDAVSNPRDENLHLAYEVLLRQYREVLTRIHVSEMEVRNLTNAFVQSASSPIRSAIEPRLDIGRIRSAAPGPRGSLIGTKSGSD